MEKNFKPIVALIATLNSLNGSIRSGERFNYRVDGHKMYVMGLTCDLANLYSLLWADCDGFSLRLSEVDGDCVLECY